MLSQSIINIVDLGLIDLSNEQGRFLQLRYDFIGNENSMGFLPNGDLILVSLKMS